MNARIMQRRRVLAKFWQTLFDWVSDHTGDALAVLVGVCALGVSVWSVHTTNRHSELSVHPELSIEYDFLMSLPQSGYFIKNKGLGPARILCMELFLDDEPVKIIGERTPLGSAVIQLQLASPAVGIEHIEQGTMLRAGEDLAFIVTAQENYADFYTPLMKSKDRLKIALAYESIYHRPAVATYPKRFSRTFAQICD